MRNNLDSSYSTNWISNKEDKAEGLKALKKAKQQEKQKAITGKRWRRLPGGKTKVFR